MNDYLIEVNPHGAIVISDFIKNCLLTRQYYGYSIEEAIESFTYEIDQWRIEQ